MDDDSAVRAFCRVVLERAGHAVLEAADGAEALELLKRTAVALIVLDNRMPRMNGHEVLRRIRQRQATANLPVIMLSGESDVDDRVVGLSAGASDYLVKPVHPDELVARVRAHLRGHLAWRRTLEQHVQERTTVGDALLRLARSSALTPPGLAAAGTTGAAPVTAAHPTLHQTAGEVCRELLALRHVAGAAVLTFTLDGGVTVAGMAGDGLEAMAPGTALASPLAARLRRNAAEERPWVELRAEQPAGSLGVPLGASHTPGAAFALLRTSGPPLGLLVIAAAPSADDESVSQSLATAIDFSQVVSVLLAPALEAHGEVHTLRRRMASMVNEGAFTPHYQPIIDLTDGAVAGYEVLTRFNDGTPPDVVFRQATTLDMTIDLESATMAAAVRDARTLPEGPWLSVNVSPTFLTSGEQLSELVHSSDRPVVLELTEHDPVTDYPELLAAVESLGAKVRLSVDDAGAGYASLKHILRLRPDYVKLDRGWITGLDTDPARQALAAGLAFFAERTGSLLIAEGVETEAELAALRRLGIRLGQGWLLGRPAPAGAIDG